jgi:Tol biopolymer transport system component
MEGAEHKVNHLMIRPDGKRFMFLHRWVKGSIRYSRLLTCNSDGTNLFNLSDNDFVSHCCWKNNDQSLSYLNKKDKGKGYYLLNDFTQEYVSIYPELKMDGHPTFSPNGKSVITDTYPDRKRIQSLYKMEGTKVTRVARFFSPFKYKGDVRCDLHPRWNYSGDKVCIDATFEGKRAVYVAYI